MLSVIAIGENLQYTKDNKPSPFLLRTFPSNSDYSRSARQLLHMHDGKCVGDIDGVFFRLWAEGPLTPIGRSGCDGFRRWNERCWNTRRPTDRGYFDNIGHNLMMHDVFDQ